jgi:hypothetical protein
MSSLGRQPAWLAAGCRNQVEHGFNRRKQPRAVATWYDTLERRYPATLTVASIPDRLRARPDPTGHDPRIAAC